MSFCLRTFFSISCSAGLLVINSFCFVFPKKSFFCLWFWKMCLWSIELQVQVLSFASSAPLSSCLHHFWWEIYCHSCFCSSAQKVSFFPLASFKMFSSVIFKQFDYDVPWFPSSCVWSPFIVFMKFGKVSGPYLFKKFFLPPSCPAGMPVT